MQNGHLRDISWHVWLEWSAGQPRFKNPSTGAQKPAMEVAIIFETSEGIASIPKGKPIRRLDDFNDYNLARPTGILNFNKLRNDIEGIRIDQAEIEQLRLIIENKEASLPEDRRERQDPIERGGSTPRYS